MNEKNQVKCIVTGQIGDRLDCLPYPGELGQKIYNQVSKQGWNQWLKQLTMIINDYGLRTCDKPAKNLIEEQMESFFFGKNKTNTFKAPKNNQ